MGRYFYVGMVVIIANAKYRISSDKLSGVYSIVNKVNGHVYIGSSFDIYGRWAKHQYDLNRGFHHSDYLQKAWRKYGKDNFEFRILELVNGEIKDRFLVEQRWVNRCLDFGMILYNMNKDVVCPIATTTIEKLRDGKRSVSLFQFKLICHYLANTDLEMCEISKIAKVHSQAVYEIYERVRYAELTKDMVFLKRTKKPVKLSDGVVTEIISRMITGQEYDADIAADYGICVGTIKDIRQHKIWKKLTKDVVFPDVSKKKGDKRKPVAQYDLDGNLIAKFSSARDASEATGIGYKLISRVCNGIRHHTHGFTFEFIVSDS